MYTVICIHNIQAFINCNEMNSKTDEGSYNIDKNRIKY